MWRILSELKSCVRGNILVMTAAGMPLFIGAAGLATDTILWALWKREIQRAADSAAIAGALTVQQARYKAEQAAIHDFRKSKAFRVRQANMWFENSPHQGPWSKDNNAVLVKVRLKTSLPFSNFFLQAPMFIQTEAVATLAKGVENCLVALDPSAARALEFTGNTQVKLNCSGVSNSGSAQSIVADGSSSVDASFMYAVGGIPATANFGSTDLQPFSSPQIDPFRDLPRPQAPGTCQAKVIVEPHAGAKTISPGCYAGLELKGNATLLPGIYYVTEENLYISSGAYVTGKGVTLILTGGSATRNGRAPAYPQLIIEGSATIDLSAPTEGDYKNVLFYQDPRATYNSKMLNSIAGNSSVKLTGGVYFPNQPVKFTGTSGMNLGCFKIVARTIVVTGNANFSNDCASDDRFRTQRVRLVS